MKIGTMLSEVPFDNFPVIVKKSGLDFYMIDNEHGAFDYSTLSRLVMISNLSQIPFIIRISDNNRMNITKFMDMGAHGLLLPMTNTADDIRQVVEYAKYYPVGKRGISTTRMHTFYNPPPLKQYMQTANEENKIYAQIETKSGVEHVDEILAVEGVAGVFIGPNDLSCDLECIGEKQPVIDCIKKVLEASKRAGKECGMITTDKDYIAVATENGLTHLSYGSELNMLVNSCKDIKNKFSEK